MAVPVVPQILNVIRLGLGRSEPSGQLALLWLMATACEKNLPLASAVEALAEDAKGRWMFKLQDFAAILKRGVPVEQAVQMVPDLLPEEAILAAKVGAKTETLGLTLRAEAQRLSSMQENNASQSVFGSMLYLSIVVAVQFAIVTFLMVNIIPKYKKIFDDFDTELPQLTTSLIDFADHSGLALLVPLCVGALVLPILWVLWGFGIRYRSLNLRNWLPRLDVGPILRQLGVVIDEGKPLIDGLHVISTQHPNTATWKKMSRVYEAVQAGENVWKMMQFEKLLKARERGLLESAERAGNLGWACSLLGRQIEDKQDHWILSWLQVIRPISIITVGLFVGWIAVAMFVPLIKLLNDLS